MYVQNQLLDGGKLLIIPFAHKSVKCAQDGCQRDRNYTSNFYLTQ